MLPDRIINKIDATGDCWTWTANKDYGGYGKIKHDGDTRVAHRVVWELLVERVPIGYQLDHLCRNRVCVNPDHLEVVAPAENTRRGDTGRNRQRYIGRERICKAGKTAAEHDHTTRPDGYFLCRTCENEYRRHQRQRKATQ